jgi:hypothetical protein
LTVKHFGAIIQVSNKEFDVGYKAVREVDNMRDTYGFRKGLEGPFSFSGRVLYYDTREGQYYDPRTDFYVPQEEMDAIHQRLADILAK